MEGNRLVFDISSDDEPSETLFGEHDPLDPSEEDYDWLREILEDVDKENQTQNYHEAEEEEESDEVVVLGECCNPNTPKSKSKSKSSPKSPSSKPVDEDEDCVVLDGDPDGPVDVAGGGGGDEDDLLVVGQKGQVACRDYPHSRHLCIKFPFNSMLHETHCELCHCYVCDVPAPCIHWGTGSSSMDHCHATDKQELWISQRKNFRLGKNAPTPVARSVIPEALIQDNQLRMLNNIRSSIPQNIVSRQVAMHACSSSISVGNSNIVSHYRNQESGFVQGRNGFVPHKVSQPVLGIRGHNIIHRSRGPAVNNLGQQYAVSSHAMFKKPGIVGGSFAACQSLNHLSHDRSCALVSRCARHSVTSASQRDKVPARNQDALPSTVLESLKSSTPSVVDAKFSESELPTLPVYESNQTANMASNEIQNFPDPVLPDSDFNWLLCGSNQHVPVGNIHLHDTGNNNEPPVAKHLNPQILDNNLDGWISLQPYLNVISSNPSAVDAGMLYIDFETSWNGLHA